MTITRTTIASLRAIRDKVFATEPPGAEEERRRAQNEDHAPLIISLAEALREGFATRLPATEAEVEQVFAQRGAVVRSVRAVFDTHAAAAAAIEREALSALDPTARADVRAAEDAALAAEQAASEGAARLAAHRRSAPTGPAAVASWAERAGVLESAAAQLARQAHAARELADRKRLAVDMTLAAWFRSQLADLDQALPAVEARYAALVEQARTERRAWYARRDALASELEAVERGELAALEG